MDKERECHQDCALGEKIDMFIGAPHQVRIRSARSKTGWLARCLKNSWLLASLSVFLNSPHSSARSFVDVDSRFSLQIL